jgi:hypothetical protein
MKWYIQDYAEMKVRILQTDVNIYQSKYPDIVTVYHLISVMFFLFFDK